MKLKINWKIFAGGIFLGGILGVGWLNLLEKELFLGFLVFFTVLLNVLECLHLVYNFQLKEYRLDRFLDGIGTDSGKKRFWLSFWGMKGLFSVVVLLLWFFGVGVEAFNFWIVVLGLICLATGLVEFGLRILEKKLFRPKFTGKVGLIIFSVIVGGLFLIFFSGLGFETGLFLWLILPIGLILNIGITVLLKPVTWVLKMTVVCFATLKMKFVRPKIVVGITGSYGKSSTKNFLSQIAEFSGKRVFVTEGNVNSEIGVAMQILKKLRKGVEIMVVEMGAYKRGEIAKIAKMVKPDIAIITAVENQHLSLFGSLEKIKQAKFELIEGTKKDGVVIVNSDSKGAKELGEWGGRLGFRKVEVKEVFNEVSENFGWEVKSVGTVKEEVGFRVLGEELEEIRFEVRGLVGGEEEGRALAAALGGRDWFEFRVGVCGRQNVPNLVMAIVAARLSGIEEKGLVEILKKIVGGKKNMEILKAGKVTLIDDSYNANPDGVRAALDFLKRVKGKKKLIMVFAGMIELGDESEKEHISVGKKIAECVDVAIISNGDFFEVIKSGWDEGEKIGELLKIEDEGEILVRLKKLVEEKEVVVLVEGRTGTKVIEYFREIGERNVND